MFKCFVDYSRKYDSCHSIIVVNNRTYFENMTRQNSRIFFYAGKVMSRAIFKNVPVALSFKCRINSIGNSMRAWTSET